MKNKAQKQIIKKIKPKKKSAKIDKKAPRAWNLATRLEYKKIKDKKIKENE